MVIPECFQREAEMWIPVMASAITLAGLRVTGYKSRAFVPVCYLYLGFLYGLGLSLESPLYSVVAFFITLVEVSVFLWGWAHMTPTEREKINSDC
jgi:hypothetical protein